MTDLSQVPTDQLLQMLQQPAPQAPPAQAPAAPPTGMGSSFLGHVGRGALDALEGVSQLNTNLSPSLWPYAKAINRGVTGQEQNYQAQRKAAGSTGFDWGRLLGNMANPMNAAASVELPSALGSALMSGGSYSAMQPVTDTETIPDYWMGKAKQVGIGVGSGGIGYGAAKLGSAILNPVYSKAKQVLLDAGVPLTMGQTLGHGVDRLEDAATSLPIVGDFIKARQRDSVVGLGRAAINQSLEPIGEALPKGVSGNEAISYASDKLGDAYQSLLPNLSATATPQFSSDLQTFVQDAPKQYLLPPDKVQQLESLVTDQVLGKADNGFYSGDALKNIQSKLSAESRRFIKSPDPDQQSLGNAIADLRSKFNAFIGQQNPKVADQLKSIDAGWANFTRVRQAAASATGGGIFTPAQLAQAVRGQAATQGQAASGHALMQELATAGKEVLPSKVPDSGTPLRHIYDLGLLLLAGGGAEAVSPEAAVGLAAGTAGGSALYSKPVQSMIRTLLTKRPDVARKLGQTILARPGIGGIAGAASALPMLQNGVTQ